MKAFDVEVGVRVKSTSEWPNKKGTVIGTKLSDGNEVVAVEWENGCLTKVNINDVEILDSELERDYEEIKKKVEMAAALLDDSNILAKKHNTSLSSLEYHQDDVNIGIGNLMDALNNAGWSTSSMSC
jgi:hypothetical protein